MTAPEGRREGRRLGRRGFIALLAGIVVACREALVPDASGPSPSVGTPSAVPSPSPTASSSPSPAPSPSPSPSVEPVGGPPVLPRWTPGENETFPNLKVMATDIVHALLDHDVDASALALAAAVAPSADRAEAMAEVLSPIVVPGSWSRVRVLYPQLSGFSDPTFDNRQRAVPEPIPQGGFPFRLSGIMALVEHHTGRGDVTEQVVTRVLDLRFVQRTETDGWDLTVLPSVGGTFVPRPADLRPATAAFLDDPRIVLPDSSRWDVHRGTVSERLLGVLNQLAEQTPFEVLVLQSGHPVNVFNTDRVSRHTMGRAADIHHIGGTLVVDDRAVASPTYLTAEFLYDLVDEVDNLGSPWALDERGGRSFTDSVHLDHFHVAVALRAPEDEQL